MTLDHDVDYIDYLYTCNRCRSCTVDNIHNIHPTCPSYHYFGFFAYSGGGKAYTCQGILEEKIDLSPETASVAMNCLLCGGCASMCPPGFDTLSFIRDLRDLHVRNGIYINDAHKKLLENARIGKIWGQSLSFDDFPVFDGSQELLVFLGSRERAKRELANAVKTILDASGITWGILGEEPDSGAALEDLGDLDGFNGLVEKNIELFNSSGAERMMILCPHDAATIINDYFNVGDLEVETMTFTAFIDELLEEGQINVQTGDAMTITYHDSCRLTRFLEEEEDVPRRILGAMEGIEFREMTRTGQQAWCCGSGAWAGMIVPDLAGYTAEKRIQEAGETGAEYIITACSYCTDFLSIASKGQQKVMHIADVIAGRLSSEVC